MCDPVTAAVVSLGTTLASAGMGFVGAQSQADAQNAAYRANAEAARVAAIDSFDSQAAQRKQLKYNADMNALQQSVQAMQARSTAAVAAGEAGVTGNSVDAFINDLTAQEGRRYSALNAQYEIDVGNVALAGKQTSANAQQRINSVRQAADPSPVPFIIQGISGSLDVFNQYQRSTKTALSIPSIV